MTTNITLKTHSWPVKVRTTDEYNFKDHRSGKASNGHRQVIEIVPPNSERTFYVTDTRRVAFEELPADYDPSTDWEMNDDAMSLNGPSTMTAVGLSKGCGEAAPEPETALNPADTLGNDTLGATASGQPG